MADGKVCLMHVDAEATGCHQDGGGDWTSVYG